MKKRGLKRYYRNLSKVDFAEKIVAEMRNGIAEYDYEHVHLDGYILKKWSEAKSHLDALSSQFEIFRLNYETFSLPFQAWGYVYMDREYGVQIMLK